jgi:hypothetical protein
MYFSKDQSVIFGVYLRPMGFRAKARDSFVLQSTLANGGNRQYDVRVLTKARNATGQGCVGLGLASGKRTQRHCKVQVQQIKIRTQPTRHCH